MCVEFEFRLKYVFGIHHDGAPSDDIISKKKNHRNKTSQQTYQPIKPAEVITL
jgi:hypothetical protein